MIFFYLTVFLVSVVLSLFFFLGKSIKWENHSSMSFECGFSSYFFSRFSFSMHYYLVGLIFLFLDLELCMLMPYFNEDFSSFKLMFFSWIFVLVLILGVLLEWGTGKLEWKF